jgi:hypothetical protein
MKTEETIKEATEIIKDLARVAFCDEMETCAEIREERVVSLVARAKQFTDRQDYLANQRSLFYCGEEIPYEKFGDQVVLNGNRKDYDPEVNALIYDLYPDVASIQHNSGWYSRGDGQLKPESEEGMTQPYEGEGRG